MRIFWPLLALTLGCHSEHGSALPDAAQDAQSSLEEDVASSLTDTEAPLLQLVVPDKYEIEPAKTVLVFAVSDNVGLKNFKLYLDNDLLAAYKTDEITNPLVYDWHAELLKPGRYQLHAELEDLSGLKTEFNTVFKILCISEDCESAVELQPFGPAQKIVEENGKSVLTLPQCGHTPILFDFMTGITGDYEATVDQVILTKENWPNRFRILNTGLFDDGLHQIKVHWKDIKEHEWEREIHFILEPKTCSPDPKLEITAPEDSDWVHSTVKLQTKTENAAVLHAFIDDNELVLDQNEMQLSTEQLTEGPHALLVYALGNDGQMTDQIRMLQVDHQKPTLNLLFPDPDKYLHNQVHFEVEAADTTSAVRMVNITCAGYQIEITKPPYVWTLDIDFMPSGPIYYEVKATDLAGNEEKIGGLLQIDRPPQIKVLPIQLEGVLSEPIDYTLELSDDLGSVHADFYEDGELVHQHLRSNNYIYIPSWYASEHLLEWRAYDESNQATILQKRVQVDHYPSTTEQWSENGQPITSLNDLQGHVSYKLTLSDDVNQLIEKSYCYIDGNSYESEVSPISEHRNEAVCSFESQELSDGWHQFNLTYLRPDRWIYEHKHPIYINKCDHDHDGEKSIICGGKDCNDEDPSINSTAEDPVGDQIDQNCDGVDGINENPEITYGPASQVNYIVLNSEQNPLNCGIGSLQGKTLKRWFSAFNLGEINDYLTRTNENGDRILNLLFEMRGYDGTEEHPLLTSTCAQMINGKLYLNKDELVNPDNPESITHNHLGTLTIDEDGIFTSTTGSFALQFPWPSTGTEYENLIIDISNVIITGQLSYVDGKLTFLNGHLEGVWTEDNLLKWIESIRSACAHLSNPPSELCSLVNATNNTRLLQILKEYPGGFDLNWENNHWSNCTQNCNSVSICLEFTAVPVEIIGLIPDEPASETVKDAQSDASHL